MDWTCDGARSWGLLCHIILFRSVLEILICGEASGVWQGRLRLYSRIDLRDALSAAPRHIKCTSFYSSYVAATHNAFLLAGEI